MYNIGPLVSRSPIHRVLIKAYLKINNTKIIFLVKEIGL